jgi:hypothetical protein
MIVQNDAEIHWFGKNQISGAGQDAEDSKDEEDTKEHHGPFL